MYAAQAHPQDACQEDVPPRPISGRNLQCLCLCQSQRLCQYQGHNQSLCLRQGQCQCQRLSLYLCVRCIRLACCAPDTVRQQCT